MRGSVKMRAGISFDESLVRKLDEYVDALATLSIDRSEIVNAILADYFEGNGAVEEVRGAVDKRRKARGTQLG